MPQNGYYFTRWILNSFYLIIDSMSSVWTMMTEPLWIDTEILGVPIYWVSEYTPLDFMFFLGLGVYLTVVFVKFFVGFS